MPKNRENRRRYISPSPSGRSALKPDVDHDAPAPHERRGRRLGDVDRDDERSRSREAEIKKVVEPQPKAVTHKFHDTRKVYSRIYAIAENLTITGDSRQRGQVNPMHVGLYKDEDVFLDAKGDPITDPEQIRLGTPPVARTIRRIIVYIGQSNDVGTVDPITKEPVRDRFTEHCNTDIWAPWYKEHWDLRYVDKDIWNWPYHPINYWEGEATPFQMSILEQYYWEQHNGISRLPDPTYSLLLNDVNPLQRNTFKHYMKWYEDNDFRSPLESIGVDAKWKPKNHPFKKNRRWPNSPTNP